MFRGEELAGRRAEDRGLLYGESQELPAYDPRAGAEWAPAPDQGYPPRFGPGGFGNVFANYTWTVAVSRGTLDLGTMDWSAVAAKTSAAGARTHLQPRPGGLRCRRLWASGARTSPAVPVDTTGLGNPLDSGMRTAMLGAGPNLYLGMRQTR